jgi:uncharacterized protein (TIGR03663 family)
MSDDSSSEDPPDESAPDEDPERSSDRAGEDPDGEEPLGASFEERDPPDEGTGSDGDESDGGESDSGGSDSSEGAASSDAGEDGTAEESGTSSETGAGSDDAAETETETETGSGGDTAASSETGPDDLAGAGAPASSPTSGAPASTPGVDRTVGQAGGMAGRGAFAHSVDPTAWVGKVRHRLETSRALQVVVAITVLAVLARLVLLGQRAAHWDEGRVAYWILRYQETGVWEYRPIVHGPFFFHVNKYLFAIFGASDFVARLPVALVGGLLPAVAWLLRDHLRDAEVVALAGILALNPLLFYYSRFMRNDVLVAGFMLFALGFFARAYVTRRPAYVYAGTLSFALAFTAKENAVLYVACWLGALGLLLDHRMLGAARRGRLTGGVIRNWIVSADPIRVGALSTLLVLNPLVVATVSVLVSSVPTWIAATGSGLVVAVAAGLLALDGTPYHALGALALVPAALSAAILGGEQALLLFTVAWVLAALLVLDQFLFVGTDSARAVVDRPSLVEGWRTWPRSGWTQRVPPMLVAYGLLFGTLIFFFAPRGGAVDGLGLWQSLVNPTQIPALLEEALLGSWQKLYATWIDAPSEMEKYPGRLEKFLKTLRATAGVVAAFAVVGFVVDRWSADGPRDVVSLATYWGAVSVLGYPYATDIWAPWVAVHAVAPLAIPAAVGVGLILRWGVESAYEGDEVGFAIVAVLLVVLAAPAAVTVVDAGYLDSDTHERVLSDSDERNQLLLQWAQPGNDMKGSLATVGAVARTNDDGPDVLFYGTNNPVSGEMLFHMKDDEVCAAQPPIHEPIEVCDGSNWHSRLPLPWYMEKYGVETTSTAPGNGTEVLQEDPPPVVIAYAWDRSRLARELPGRYEASEHRFKLWDENVVIFLDQAAVPAG